MSASAVRASFSHLTAWRTYAILFINTTVFKNWISEDCLHFSAPRYLTVMADTPGAARSFPETCSENKVTVVEEPAPSLVCVECARVFFSARSLLDHGTVCKIEKEASRKRFQCAQCSRAFKSMTSLRNHLRTHPVQQTAQLDMFISLSTRNESTIGNASTWLERSDHIDIDLTLNENTLSEPIISTDKMRNFCVSTPINARRLSLNCDVSAVKTTRRRSMIPISASRRMLDASKAETPKHTRNSEGETLAADSCSSLPESQKAGKIIMPGTNPASSTSRNVTRSMLLTPTRRRQPLKRFTKVPKYRFIEQEERLSAARDRSFQTCGSTDATKTEGGNQSKPKTLAGTPRRLYKNNRSTSRTPSRARKMNVSTPSTPLSAKKTPLSTKKTPLSSRKTPLSAKKTPLSIKKSSQSEIGTPGKHLHKCCKCGKGFLTKAQLEVHFIVHIRETPKRCGVAMETLKRNPRSLQLCMDGRAVDTPRPVKDQTHVCTDCGRSFDQERLLISHMKTHSTTKAYECNVCNKKFKHQSNLRLHLITHKREEMDSDMLCTTEGTYKAPEAMEEISSVQNKNIFSMLKSEKFAELEDLTELEEMFTCKSCDFKTRDPASLLLHMRTHSKQRKYMCTMCEKSYSSEKNLKVHVKVHTIGRIKTILLTRSGSRTDRLDCLGLERLDNLLIPHSRKQDMPDIE